MNDYYAREVSEKLVQAHRLSRERGEFWGSRPPYGYQRAEENSKKLVPEPEESEIIRQIFYWYVFEEMSSYDIARELNGRKVLGPEDSYQKGETGKGAGKKAVMEIRRYPEDFTEPRLYRCCCLWENKTDAFLRRIFPFR